MNRTAMTVIALLLVLALVISSAMSLTSIRSDRDDGEAVQPLISAAQTFPVPPNSRVAFPDSVTTNPPEVVKGWFTAGSLEDACVAWREAYRLWLGQQQGNVEGEVTPGLSCSFTAARNGLQTSLVVAKYASADPQATLRIWQPQATS